MLKVILEIYLVLTVIDSIFLLLAKKIEPTCSKSILYKFIPWYGLEKFIKGIKRTRK